MKNSINEKVLEKRELSMDELKQVSGGADSISYFTIICTSCHTDYLLTNCQTEDEAKIYLDIYNTSVPCQCGAVGAFQLTGHRGSLTIY